MDEYYEQQEREVEEALTPPDDPFNAALERIRETLRDALASALIAQGQELPPVLDGLAALDPEEAGLRARETLIEEQWALARLAEIEPDEARRLVSAIGSSTLVADALTESPTTPPDLLWLLGRVATRPYERADDETVDRGAVVLDEALAADEAAPEQIAALLSESVDDIAAAVRSSPPLRGDLIDLLANRPGLLMSVSIKPELAPLLALINELMAMARFAPYARGVTG